MLHLTDTVNKRIQQLEKIIHTKEKELAKAPEGVINLAHRCIIGSTWERLMMKTI